MVGESPLQGKATFLFLLLLIFFWNLLVIRGCARCPPVKIKLARPRFMLIIFTWVFLFWWRWQIISLHITVYGLLVCIIFTSTHSHSSRDHIPTSQKCMHAGIRQNGVVENDSRDNKSWYGKCFGGVFKKSYYYFMDYSKLME